MTNVIQFKTKQQLRIERTTAIADKWLAEQDIKAQEHTVKCFLELTTEMDNLGDRWVARLLVKEEENRLEAMYKEFQEKYGS